MTLRPKTPKPSPFVVRACSAEGCTRKILPTQVFCPSCWKWVGQKHRAALVAAYQAGVPASANGSPEWIDAVRGCIEGIKASREFGFVDGKPMRDEEEDAETDDELPPPSGHSLD